MNQHNPVKVRSVAVLFQNTVEKHGDKAAVSYKKDNSYHDISWNELNGKVKNTAKYLLSIGIEKGDRVGVWAYTRYEWWVADLAILSIGAVTVPIHFTNSPEESYYVLNHSEAKACFVGNKEDLNNCLAIKK